MNKKKLLMFGLPILAMALVAAAVWIASISTTVTVNEALSTSTISLSPSGVYPDGIEHCDNITVTNAASVPLNAKFTWTQTSNINASLYLTNMDTSLLVELLSGDNIVPACFTVETGQPTTIIEGTVTIERVA